MALFLKEEEVRRILSMDLALAAVEEALREYGEGRALNNPRQRLKLPGGTFHLMAAARPARGVFGFKGYASFAGKTRFHFYLFSSVSGEILAVMECNFLGRQRTGAASGVATRYMAREDADVAAVLGTGRQARSQLEAVCAVRPVREVRAYSRSAEKRQAFAAAMTTVLGIPVTSASSAEAAVRGAGIVVTITKSSTPVLKGEWLAEGTHVNAAGSNHLLRRELDEAAVERADLVVVDDADQARIECGDLFASVESGRLPRGRVRELGEVVCGRVAGRPAPGAITLFESQGLALEDVAVGALVYERARAAGLGIPLPF